MERGRKLVRKPVSDAPVADVAPDGGGVFVSWQVEAEETGERLQQNVDKSRFRNGAVLMHLLL